MIWTEEYICSGRINGAINDLEKLDAVYIEIVVLSAGLQHFSSDCPLEINSGMLLAFWDDRLLSGWHKIMNRLITIFFLVERLCNPHLEPDL